MLNIGTITMPIFLSYEILANTSHHNSSMASQHQESNQRHMEYKDDFQELQNLLSRNTIDDKCLGSMENDILLKIGWLLVRVANYRRSCPIPTKMARMKQHS